MSAWMKLLVLALLAIALTALGPQIIPEAQQGYITYVLIHVVMLGTAWLFMGR